MHFKATGYGWGNRGTGTERGYGARWQKLRRMILNRDPVCRSCGRLPATEVDHVVSKGAGGQDTEENLQGLCHRCHAAKTYAESRGLTA